MGDADYLYAFHKLVMPIAYEFAPELVISEKLLRRKYYIFMNSQFRPGLMQLKAIYLENAMLPQRDLLI